MNRRVASLAAVLLFGLGLAACGSDDTGGVIAEDPDDTSAEVTKIDVKAAEFTFNPTEIALTAGEDVQFVIDNGDQVEHNLTIEGLGVDQDVEAGASAEAPLTQDLKPGSYPYTCEYHPAQMKGTVTVT